MVDADKKKCGSLQEITKNPGALAGRRDCDEGRGLI